jgi:hypothetical protein
VKRKRPKSRCQRWRGSIDRSSGYGYLRQNGRRLSAHRMAYEKVHGPLPPGVDIHHRCENTSCVRLSHLEPLPHGVHALLGNSPWARNARKTHCAHGHKFTPANTGATSKGHRRCRACARIRSEHKRRKLGVGIGHANARKTHCSHGHKFTAANTYIRPDRGTRECRACNLARYHHRRSLLGPPAPGLARGI